MKKITKKPFKPELLAPISDFTSLTAAIAAGTDAVYFGIKTLNMRAKAENFNTADMKKIADICHKNKIKAYLALNIMIYDNELNTVENLLKKAKQSGIDAVICWDHSVITLAKKLKLPIHLSTQASVSNFEALKFYYKQGIRRFVLARELNLKQINSMITKIKKEKLKAEIEVFIHGARCISVSGRCYLSQDVYKQSANRGHCLQVCRRSFIIKDKEDNYELEVDNEFVLSPKDLCTIPILPQIIDSGINSFKIEGRKRKPEYVKTVVECYRQAIDFILDNKNKTNFNKEYDKLSKQLVKRLESVYNKGFSTGFYLGIPLKEDHSGLYGSKATTKKEFIGIVKNYYKKIGVAEILCQSRGFKKHDKIQIQGPTTGVVDLNAEDMQIDGKSADNALKGKRIGLKTNTLVRSNDKVYKIIKLRR
ncbi:peptidase U32 family protein [Nanoarchaeota archaeon]